jgi:biotin transport system substrate-specific component
MSIRNISEAVQPPLVSGGGRSALRLAALVVVGVAALSLSAKIQIPFWPVPMTLQTLVVLLIGAGAGARTGVVTVAAYLAVGAAGFPVFAGSPERGIGLVYMAGPTGGYLIGFLAGAWTAGLGKDWGWSGRSFLRLVGIFTLSHVLMLACGVAWLAMSVGLEKAWMFGFLPFTAATIVKTLLAATIVRAAQAAIVNRS